MVGGVFRSIGLAAAVVMLLGAGVASAAPTVRFKAVPLPIAGFQHTGYLLGAGSALEVEYLIEGTEYGGFPPPLIGVNFYLPTGSMVHSAGFATCEPHVLIELKEPGDCPAQSLAGTGSAYGIVSFGETRVPEEAVVKAFYAPGGGLTFFTFGHSPVLLEIPSTAHYTNLAGAGGMGPELISQIPLVETVPGAADASVERIKIKVGSAYRKGGRAYYYGTVPRRCTAAGFSLKTELIFAGLGGLTQQTVTARTTAPCPRR